MLPLGTELLIEYSSSSFTLETANAWTGPARTVEGQYVKPHAVNGLRIPVGRAKLSNSHPEERALAVEVEQDQPHDQQCRELDDKRPRLPHARGKVPDEPLADVAKIN